MHNRLSRPGSVGPSHPALRPLPSWFPQLQGPSPQCLRTEPLGQPGTRPHSWKSKRHESVQPGVGRAGSSGAQGGPISRASQHLGCHVFGSSTRARPPPPSLRDPCDDIGPPGSLRMVSSLRVRNPICKPHQPHEVTRTSPRIHMWRPAGRDSAGRASSRPPSPWSLPGQPLPGSAGGSCACLAHLGPPAPGLRALSTEETRPRRAAVKPASDLQLVWPGHSPPLRASASLRDVGDRCRRPPWARLGELPLWRGQQRGRLTRAPSSSFRSSLAKWRRRSSAFAARSWCFVPSRPCASITCARWAGRLWAGGGWVPVPEGWCALLPGPLSHPQLPPSSLCLCGWDASRDPLCGHTGHVLCVWLL